MLLNVNILIRRLISTQHKLRTSQRETLALFTLIQVSLWMLKFSVVQAVCLIIFETRFGRARKCKKYSPTVPHLAWHKYCSGFRQGRLCMCMCMCFWNSGIKKCHLRAHMAFVSAIDSGWVSDAALEQSLSLDSNSFAWHSFLFCC